MGDVDVRSERMMALASRLVVRERDRDLLKILETSDRFTGSAFWKNFRAAYPTVEALDLGQMKLMARVVRKLRELAVEDPDLERYAGIARFLWVRSKVTRRRALDVCAELQKRGIVVCALKGLALHLGHGISAEEHPIWDADLLPDKFDVSVKVLKELGFQQGASDAHATTFLKNHTIIDLHRYPVVQDPELDFFAGATIVDRTRVPTPLNCFLHAMLHGVHSDLLWMFDCQKLIDRVDLERVKDYARLRRLRGIIGAALSRSCRSDCRPDCKSSRITCARALGLELLRELTEHEYLELVAYASRGRVGSYHWIHAARRAERQLREARTSGRGFGALPRARVEARWAAEWEMI